jgi:hypothetical protein
MKRIRIIGLCLVVMFAVSVVAAASASAQRPEFMTCLKAGKEKVTYKGVVKEVYTGKYTEAKCVTLAPKGKYRAEGKPEGKFELGAWNAGKKVSFATKSGPTTFYNYTTEFGGGPREGKTLTGQGGVVKCTLSKGKGEVTSAIEYTMKVEYTGCTSLGKECKSEGAKPGVIKSTELHNELAYLPGQGEKVADYLAFGEPEPAFSKIVCGEVVIKEGFSGTTGVASGNINSASKTFVNTFKVTTPAEGVQEQGYTEETLGTLEGPFFMTAKLSGYIGVSSSDLGVETTSTITGEALEIHT